MDLAGQPAARQAAKDGNDHVVRHLGVVVRHVHLTTAQNA
jgi:hypothetical protein